MKNTYVKNRYLAVLYDYISISIYLIVVLLITMFIFNVVIGEIPEFSKTESHLISFGASVLPVLVYFSFKEAKIPYQSFGKKRKHLYLTYNNNPLLSALIRNSIKFLPWQLAHIAVVEGMYQGFDTVIPTMFLILSGLLFITINCMVIFQKDHKHLGDILSNSICKEKVK